jgi:hypothetical protein
MIARCERPHHPAYKNYGARGITVCERWRSFETFIADMGERPSAAHSLDRKDNDLGYFPDNCRWATDEEQNDNKRKVTRTVEIDGREMPLLEACKLRGIEPQIVYQRLCNGWTVDDALTDPRWPDGYRRGAPKRRKK